MTGDYLTTTQSTCRECRKLVPARIFLRPDGVWFSKICPDHGTQEVRVYSDAKAYLKLSHFHRQASMPLKFLQDARGCPDSCGLCSDHEQHVCLPIIEITDHCNLQCPICLVTTPARAHRSRAEVAHILDLLIQTEGQIDVLNLSGGEPTLNPHFRDIVEECLSRKEILRVSVSTNGLTLERDRDLLSFLAERNVIISLQFDGTRDEIYQALRGRPLLDQKMGLIETCGQLNASMSLTATVAHSVNDRDLSGIAELLFQHEHILGVMFQPAAYAGAARKLGRPARATTIPDVIARLHGAAKGIVSSEDFSPLPCSHPACFSLAFYLNTGQGEFVSIKQLVNAQRFLNLVQNRAIFGTDPDSFRDVTDAVYDLWSGPAALSPDSKRAMKSVKSLLTSVTDCGCYSPHRALQVAERSIKSIFIHGFMDPDTFDLSRARKCCQVYPQPDGRLMPACVYNCLHRNSSVTP